jgi:hypothetical protein
MGMLSRVAQLMSIQALLATGCAATDTELSDSDEESAVAQQVASAGGVDLSGTWAARVKTAAKITAPLIGASNGPVDLGIKLFVKRSGGTLTADVQLCALTTDSANLKVDYSKALQYMKVTISEPDFVATVGGKVPLPLINVLVGIDAAGAAVDTDGDTNPGTTLPVVALGLLPINSYTGLNLKINLDATLKSADLIEGTSTFGGTGKIFGSNFPLLSAGELLVEQTQNPTAFSAKRIAGDVTCADAMAKL